MRPVTKRYWWLNIVTTSLNWLGSVWVWKPMIAGIFPPVNWIVFMLLWGASMLALPAAIVVANKVLDDKEAFGNKTLTRSSKKRR
jgi:hypothetical protein